MEEKKYRVEYSMYEVLSVQEDGEFNTASGYSLIADTLPRIRIVLGSLGVNCDKLNDIQ